jgi:hypothetical protein
MYARGAEPAMADETAAPRFTRFRASSTGWMALAASALLAVGLSMYLVVSPAGPPTAPAVERSPAVLPSTTNKAPAQPDTSAVKPPVSLPTLPSDGRPTELSKTRGADRRIGGKTFRLEAGTWVDTAYDSKKFLPVVDISAAERADRLRDIPSLRPYAALGPRVIVVIDGKVYRMGVNE